MKNIDWKVKTIAWAVIVLVIAEQFAIVAGIAFYRGVEYQRGQQAKADRVSAVAQPTPAPAPSK